MKEINDFTLREFLEKHIKIKDFGYLVVTDNKQLNDEALQNIKRDFKKYLRTDTGLFADLDEKQAQKGIDAIKSMSKKNAKNVYKGGSVEEIIEEGRDRHEDK